MLSDADFVHRMWESDEESDDEESSATSCDDASDEMGSVVEGRSVSQSTLPISAYFRVPSLEL